MKSAPASLPQTRPPLERMLRIHQAIQAGGYPNTTTLARDLEVCTKTVQRDLEFMRDRLELPLSYDGRKFGYHYTMPVSAFPSLQVTEGELFALLVAEKSLQQYRGTNFEKPLVSAFRKMAASLPDTVSVHLADWEQTISFRTSAEPLLDLGVFDALAKASTERQRLRFVYRKPGQRRGDTREVDPYHLANINGEWFLFAFDLGRQALRTFAPARISQIERTGDTFARPKKFSLERQLRDSFGVITGTGEHDVVVQFTEYAADIVREKRWHPSQQLRELPGGGVELSFRLSSLVEIQRWILGWGGQATASSPPELVAALHEAGRQLAARHPGPPLPPA